MTGKYHNKKTSIDGYTFASLKEAARYQELKLLSHTGSIRDLELQPSFEIAVNGRYIAKYLADFRYVDVTTDKAVTEDVKGGSATKTALYKLKKKLVEALYGIEIVEV